MTWRLKCVLGNANCEYYTVDGECKCARIEARTDRSNMICSQFEEKKLFMPRVGDMYLLGDSDDVRTIRAIVEDGNQIVMRVWDGKRWDYTIWSLGCLQRLRQAGTLRSPNPIL